MELLLINVATFAHEFLPNTSECDGNRAKEMQHALSSLHPRMFRVSVFKVELRPECYFVRALLPEEHKQNKRLPDDGSV